MDISKSRAIQACNRLTTWRNQGKIGRRVVAEVGYAGLAIAALIEAVAKLALTLFCWGAGIFMLGSYGISFTGARLFGKRESSLENFCKKWSTKCFILHCGSADGTGVCIGGSLVMIGFLFKNLFSDEIRELPVR